MEQVGHRGDVGVGVRASVGEVVDLAPGVEGPTVSTLAKEGWYAVRVLVPRKGAHLLMDQLYEAGARGILLTELTACRL